MKQTNSIGKNESWTVNRFLKVKPYEKNRAVEHRIKKMVTNLSSGFIPGHVEVKVGRAINDFSSYKKGDLFRLDGNTRAATWEKFPELRPSMNLDVKIYECSSKEEADKIYYSIDSSDSVETSPDKMTGLFRERNYSPLSDTLKKGKIKTFLDLACRYGKDKDGIYLQTASIETKLNAFWNELIYLDKHQSIFDFPKSSVNVYAVLLLVGKKYGIKHPRYKTLIDNFVNEVTVINDKDKQDGVNYVFNTLYSAKRDVWKYNGYSSYKKGESSVICDILYGFDCFMNNQTIPKNKKNLLTQTKLRELWMNYMD